MLKQLKLMISRLPAPEPGSSSEISSYEIPDRIPYHVISMKLCRAMEANKDIIGGRTLIPNQYRIYFNENDREMRKHTEDILIEELTKSMLREGKKFNRELTDQDLNLELFSDDSLEKGKVRIQCFFRDNGDPEQDVDEIKSFTKEGEQDQDDVMSEIEGLFDGTEPCGGNVDESSIERGDSSIGQSPDHIIEVDDGIEVKVYKIDQEEIILGRADDAHIRLPDETAAVSRKHAVLKKHTNNMKIIPVGINGTFLNGYELELDNPTVVTIEDVIMIRNYRIKFRQINEAPEKEYEISEYKD